MVQHRREKPKRQNGSHSRRDHCRTCQRRGTLSARRLHRQGSSAPPQSSGSDRSIARRAPLQSPASLRPWTRPYRWRVVAGDRPPACTCVDGKPSRCDRSSSTTRQQRWSCRIYRIYSGGELADASLAAFVLATCERTLEFCSHAAFFMPMGHSLDNKQHGYGQ